MRSSNVLQLEVLRDTCQKVYDMHTSMEEINNTPTLDEVRAAPWIEFIKDDHGVMLAVSKGYTTMCGIASADYEGLTDEQVWGKDGAEFEMRDRYVRETGFTLETTEVWLNGKDKMYQSGMVIKVPYPLENGRIGTRGKIHRDSLKYIDAAEYQRLTKHNGTR